MTKSTFYPSLDFNRRDVTCLAVAVAVHSLLFLWKGGLFNLPEVGNGLGEMLVQVDFMTEVPSWNEAAPTGGRSGSSGNLFKKVKSMFQKQPIGGGKQVDAPSIGKESPKIAVEQPKWSKAETKLSDKNFSTAKGFQGAAEKKIDMDIATAKSQDILVRASKGNFEEASPNLKQKSFTVSSKDMPFPVLKNKPADALVNVNAIPMNIGKTTSSNVKSLDGGTGAGPALQSKTLASKGSQTASFGSANKGFSGSASGGGGSGDDSFLNFIGSIRR